MGRENDRALRFYNEVLGLERLHYGLWSEGDELTLENLKRAQVNYENLLIDNIPNSVKTVLDVGCGTGILVKALVERGYSASGLSPDRHQKKVFEERGLNASFYSIPFEEFSESECCDCIIMSESAQYINPTKLLDNAARALSPGGTLMICDYFVWKSASGELAKSGHQYEAFVDQVEKSPFTVKTDRDITDQVTKTLDLGKDFVTKMESAFDIATESTRTRFPLVSKVLRLLLRKKIRQMEKQRVLLDSDAFTKNKSYRFMLLQKCEPQQ